MEKDSTEEPASKFGELVKLRRQKLELSAEGLARLLSKSTGYIQLVEANKRGVDLKELSEWALALKCDAKSLIQAYLYWRYRSVFEVLFPDTEPELVDERPGDAIRDVAARLHSLPRDIRTGIEATILAVYDRLNSMEYR